MVLERLRAQERIEVKHFLIGQYLVVTGYRPGMKMPTEHLGRIGRAAREEVSRNLCGASFLLRWITLRVTDMP
jgi:hypothetical protein